MAPRKSQKIYIEGWEHSCYPLNMSQIPEVQAIKLLEGRPTADQEQKNDHTGEIQWSERVRALLLAQPLNPLQVLEFKPL